MRDKVRASLQRMLSQCIALSWLKARARTHTNTPHQITTDLEKESSLGQSPQNLQCGWMNWIITTEESKASTGKDLCGLGLGAAFFTDLPGDSVVGLCLRRSAPENTYKVSSLWPRSCHFWSVSSLTSKQLGHCKTWYFTALIS